jgi:hypothetical protein
MKPRGVEEILQILEAMRQAETAMSVLYRVCARRWPEDSSLWLSLSSDEVKHSENVKILSDIIREKICSGTSFQYNRHFTVNSVQSFISGVTETAERVRQNKISKKKTLAVVFDIECAALERAYSQLVKTDDVEYQSIANVIDIETQLHRDKIKKKINEAKKVR